MPTLNTKFPQVVTRSPSRHGVQVVEVEDITTLAPGPAVQAVEEDTRLG